MGKSLNQPGLRISTESWKTSTRTQVPRKHRDPRVNTKPLDHPQGGRRGHGEKARRSQQLAGGADKAHGQRTAVLYENDIYEIAVDNYYLITTEQAAEAGVPGVELAKLVHRGKLENVSRGLYRFARWVPEKNYPYAETVMRMGTGDTDYLRMRTPIANVIVAQLMPLHHQIAQKLHGASGKAAGALTTLWTCSPSSPRGTSTMRRPRDVRKAVRLSPVADAGRHVHEHQRYPRRGCTRTFTARTRKVFTTKPVFDGKICWNLRCSLLHSGDYEVPVDWPKEDNEFLYGYAYELILHSCNTFCSSWPMATSQERVTKNATVRIDAGTLASAPCDSAENCLARTSSTTIYPSLDIFDLAEWTNRMSPRSASPSLRLCDTPNSLFSKESRLSCYLLAVFGQQEAANTKKNAACRSANHKV